MVSNPTFPDAPFMPNIDVGSRKRPATAAIEPHSPGEEDLDDKSTKRSRSKRACTKCQSRKTKCSGGKPCRYCLMLNKPHECVFIVKEKPKLVTIQESYLNSLKLRVQELEQKHEPSVVAHLQVKSINGEERQKTDRIGARPGAIIRESQPGPPFFLSADQNRRMSLTHIINSSDAFALKRIDSNNGIPPKKYRTAEEETADGHYSDLARSGETAPEESQNILSRTTSSTITPPTGEGSDYVLEKELAVRNLLVETNVSYLTNFNVFLGNSNCTKYNLTIQNVLTTKINTIINYYNVYHNLGIKLLPPPVLPTVYYKASLLHWNQSDLSNVALPDKGYTRSIITMAFESVGSDSLIVNQYGVFEMIEKVYSGFENCSKIELIQLLVLTAIGECMYFSINKEAAAAAENPPVQALLTEVNEPSQRQFPGFQYFQQAIELFEYVFEECSIIYIETCLLMGVYSLALNRKDSGYVYTGLAIRLAYTMGLHRKVPEAYNGLTKIQLEKRRRLWWCCYIWDRTITIRLGHPVMINDESMDVELPSHKQFKTEQELKVYPKPPTYLIEQIKLAKISGIILNKIYSFNKTGKFKDSFIVSVHSILNLLRFWFKDLNDKHQQNHSLNQDLSNIANLKKSKSTLKLNYVDIDIGLKRQTYSLHLNYNYCIILTTRPLLLYIFKETLFQVENEHSPTTLGILKSCINASLINLKIIQILNSQNSYGSFALLDNNYLFGSILVLLLINFIKNYNSLGFNLFTRIFQKSTEKADAKKSANHKHDKREDHNHATNCQHTKGLPKESREPNVATAGLTQKELTSKIKFGVSLLETTAALGSVTAKVYYLQLSNLLNLLDKLTYLNDLKRNNLEKDACKNYINDIEEITTRLENVTTKNVVTDVSLFNKLNLIEHGSPGGKHKGIPERVAKELAVAVNNSNSSRLQSSKCAPGSLVDFYNSHNDRNLHDSATKSLSFPQISTQSLFSQTSPPLHGAPNSHKIPDAQTRKEASHHHNTFHSTSQATSQGSTPSAVSYLEQEFFQNDEFNLLNDDMLSGFLNYSGWKISSPSEELFTAPAEQKAHGPQNDVNQVVFNDPVVLVTNSKDNNIEKVFEKNDDDDGERGVLQFQTNGLKENGLAENISSNRLRVNNDADLQHTFPAISKVAPGDGGKSKLSRCVIANEERGENASTAGNFSNEVDFFNDIMSIFSLPGTQKNAGDGPV